MKHLHELTKQDKIKLAAELDGWTLAIQKGNVFGVAFRMRDAFNKPIWEDELPSYATSYDAIIPLIQKLSKTADVEDYAWDLFRLQKPSIEYILNATPSQLLDALLVATGKCEL